MWSITIEWRDAEDGSVQYSANGRELGSGDDGFDAALKLIRANPKATVTLKGVKPGLGGQSLGDTAPFANRFSELIEALGERNISWDLS